MSEFTEANMPSTKNTKQVPILLGFVMVVALGAMFFFLYKPSKAESSSLTTEIATAQSRYDALSRTLADYRQDSQSFEALLATVEEADSYVPFVDANTIEEQVFDLKIDLQILVDQIVKRENLDVIQGTYALTTPAGSPERLAAIGVPLTIEGSLDDLDLLMAELEAAGQLATIQSFTAGPEGESDSLILAVDGRMRLNVEVLFWFTTARTAIDDAGTTEEAPVEEDIIPLDTFDVDDTQEPADVSDVDDTQEPDVAPVDLAEGAGS